MTKIYYRGMAEKDGKPKIGRSARLLGVRLGIDIDVEQVPRDWLDEQGYLLAEPQRNNSGYIVAVAIRNDKGMSVSLSIESLPAFRRPAIFGGTGLDPLWQIESSKITGELQAVQDSATHVSILPITTMLLEKYETALANTKNDWERV
ncbi:hypothetical protein IQ259_09165 [Fortiea sp. LEGE XX443]|uniref:Tse2 family ADP-ribosyltransferase toxin n=1 Tax=Fortiea sp. LEGE XX443 TaxID=1828611 RepID=UPI0018816860|nr:hypothetical protein [Fortiea sp. LEGE XX443]MBE9005208.1 hypothetical protein [Fortiea sp. LEGE XX443]